MYTFTNPIVPTPHADPWVTFEDGYYYYCFSRAGNQLCVAKAERLCDIGKADPVCVYTAPEGTLWSKSYWAPELHRFGDIWVIYVAADDGQNANHRMYALTADKPQGQFRMVGKISSPDDHWAIDGTVMTFRDKLYFIWSGWEGDVDVSQQLYIAPMSDPFTVCGERECICRPEYDWECHGRPTVNEGPVALTDGTQMHLIYSASGSWTDDYCLGCLTLVGENPLDPDAWKKAEQPLFTKTETAYGPGHCSFTVSPDGNTHFIVYHANEVSGSGWKGRSVRAQTFVFRDGYPVLGTPVRAGEPQQIEE